MGEKGYDSGEAVNEERRVIRRQKHKLLESQLEELRYRRKIVGLLREIRGQVYTNAAMVDEVDRLNCTISKVEEENKIIIRQLRNYERNRIRRIKNHLNREDAAAAQNVATPVPSPTPDADDTALLDTDLLATH